MKLISLIDNTAVDDKLFSENGMSFFVEFGGKNYIIDTGLTGKAAENARRMQLPTDELDAVVLTHNHAAHVGGIDSFMRLSPDAEIYLRAGAQTERFRKTGFFKEPVGAGKAFFKKYADDLILFNRFSEVAEGFYLASCEIQVQDADVVAFDGTVLHAKNIIGIFSPEKTDRILLFAHWDSRPFADNDPDEANHRKPVLGANDGASGVGALLEIARQIGMKSPQVGMHR